MKTCIHILVACSIVASLIACEAPSSNNYERIERLESGAISRRVQIVNGKKEGKMTDYYPDGKLMAERWFKNNMQEGKATIYYPAGQIKEVQYFQEGMQFRGDTIWYENGKIQFAVTLEKDKKNGYLRKWSMDGALIFECRYANDTLVEVKGKPISRESLQARYSGDTLIQPSNQ